MKPCQGGVPGKTKQFQGALPSQRRLSQQYTMFNIFKRSVPAPAKAQTKSAARPAGRAAAPDPGKATAPALPEEASLPEVVEGNEHTDWALWEDSVSVLDSQMQDLTPSARIYERDKQTPSQFQDIDPFSKIHKNSA